MRIALVAPPYFETPPTAYGGIEAVVADLADLLVDRGHDVTLVGAGRPGTRAEFAPLWERPVPDRIGEAYPELMHAAASRRELLRRATRRGLDIVHDHTAAGVLNAAVYGAHGLPTVATAHSQIDDEQRRLYRAVGDELALVAISDRQRALAPDLNWVSTVYNGLDVRSWPYRDRKGDYALFLGRFHPQKAPHLALEAAHAADLPLVMAGKCTEPIERAYFEREVVPRLTERDHIFGVADRFVKRKLLVDARCLLFPVQWEEPFGLVMIEAMACGTPVVALRGGAVGEVVDDGTTGIICEHPRQLGPALHGITSINPAACRRRVVECFSTERLVAGYEATYERLVARRRATVRSVSDPALRVERTRRRRDLALLKP